jgi:hypothetical protein
MFKLPIKAIFTVASALAAFPLYAAPPEKYGDWTFSVLQSGKDRMADASVASNGSEKLHKQCSTTITGCIWIITLANIKCAKGEEFPFLANSNAGSASFKVACFPTAGETTTRLMILGDVGWIDEMAKAGTFAFAFPSIQTPAFKVAIFSGNGAAVALKKIDEFSAQPFKQEM